MKYVHVFQMSRAVKEKYVEASIYASKANIEYEINLMSKKHINFAVQHPRQH